MALSLLEDIGIIVALILGGVGTYLGYRSESRIRRERRQHLDREVRKTAEYLIGVLEAGSQVDIRMPFDITPDLKRTIECQTALKALLRKVESPPSYIADVARREDKDFDLAKIHKFADILHHIALTREVPLPDDEWDLEFTPTPQDEKEASIPTVDPIYQDNRIVLVLTSLFHQLYLALEKIARETKGLVEHNDRLFWKVVGISDEFSKSYSAFFAACGRLVIEQDQLLRKHIKRLAKTPLKD